MFAFREQEPFALEANSKSGLIDFEEKLPGEDDDSSPMHDASEEGEEAQLMDVADDEMEDDDTGGIFEFPDPSPNGLVYGEGGTKVRFNVDVIPKTFPVVSPQTMHAMASITQITGAQKAQFAHLPALPGPVHVSPMVTLLESKVNTGAQAPWKPRYTSWMITMFQLAQFMEVARAGIIPVPPQTDPQLAVEESFVFQNQVRHYKRMHYERIYDLHRQVLNDPSRQNVDMCITRFAAFLEDFSLFYVHCMERFLFNVLIAPHNSDMTLDLVLTHFDRPTLEQCENKAAAQTLLAEFFQLKVETFKDRENGSTDVHRDYSALDLQQIPHRVSVNSLTGAIVSAVPKETVYRGFTDRQTLLEYFLFLDRSGILLKTRVE